MNLQKILVFISKTHISNIAYLFRFIKEGIECGGCFVHCAFGQSRSATIIIAYIMKENNWKFKEAYEYVKAKRRMISPNHGFVYLLRLYEVELGLSTLDEVKEDMKQNQYVRSTKYMN